MQNVRAIVLHPMLFALLLSVAVHAATLYSRSISVPAAPQLDAGETVVQLTLLPSAASAPEPQLPEEAKTEALPPPAIAPLENDVPTAKPAAKPEPKPVTEPVEATQAPASIEQDASPEIEKGVTADAVSTSAFRPAYPRISRRRGEEGTVTLLVQVLADGSVGDVSLHQSSGHDRLDEAALQAARQTTFKPALLLGRAVESTSQLSYTFRLTDD